MAKRTTFNNLRVGEFFTTVDSAERDIAIYLNRENWIKYIGGWEKEIWGHGRSREVYVLEPLERAIIARGLAKSAIRAAERAARGLVSAERVLGITLPDMMCFVSMRAMVPSVLDYCLSRELILGDPGDETRKLVLD